VNILVLYDAGANTSGSPITVTVVYPQESWGWIPFVPQLTAVGHGVIQ
jgi:hypothetical protein